MNNLQKKRDILKLTMDQLADQENVQFSTIGALENNAGVFREKPRAMRMLIRLGVPYIINHRGSIVIKNDDELQDLKGDMHVVYEDKHYNGANLGNGLLQETNGSVYYNELRDAIAQSGLSLEDFSKKYNTPVQIVSSLASGKRPIDHNIDIVDLLDQLSIPFSYTATDKMYIRRNFQISDDVTLAKNLENSLYLDRLAKIKVPVPIDVPEDNVVPVDFTQVVEDNTLLQVIEDTQFDVDDQSHELLDRIKTDLKTVLGEHNWNEEEKTKIKEAFTVIGVRQLQYEVINL